jgi:hypothetical protein
VRACPRDTLLPGTGRPPVGVELLVDKQLSGDTDSFGALFSPVERCLLEGDDEAVNLVVVGLLEELQNSNITHARITPSGPPIKGRRRFGLGRPLRQSSTWTDALRVMAAQWVAR